MARGVAWIGLLCVLVALPLGAQGAGQSSASFTIDQDVIGGGWGERGSTSYRVRDTVGQSSATGESDSSSFRLYAGFWGPIGSVLPPPVPALGTLGLLLTVLGLSWVIGRRRRLA